MLCIHHPVVLWRHYASSGLWLRLIQGRPVPGVRHGRSGVLGAYWLPNAAPAQGFVKSLSGRGYTALEKRAWHAGGRAE